MSDLRLTNLRKAIQTHKMSGAPEYKTWASMIQRCTNKKLSHYRLYGGRGIKICERWMKFENFYSDMGARPELKYTLDRIDSDGDYTPENCRWANKVQQSQNQKRIRLYEMDGNKLCIAEWGRIYGIHDDTVRSRLKMGWGLKRALTERVKPLKGRARDKDGHFIS